jgi:hypothetical protein
VGRYHRNNQKETIVDTDSIADLTRRLVDAAKAGRWRAAYSLAIDVAHSFGGIANGVSLGKYGSTVLVAATIDGQPVEIVCDPVLTYVQLLMPEVCQ